MKEFKKKIVIVLAFQWLGSEEQKAELLADGVIMDIPSRDGSCLVPTINGNLTCMVGDYIIKDKLGAYSVSEAAVFEAEYDAVEEEEVLEGDKKSEDDPVIDTANMKEDAVDIEEEAPVKEEAVKAVKAAKKTEK